MFLGVLIWKILGKQDKESVASATLCPPLAVYFFFLLSHSFCFGVTLELSSNRTGEKHLYDKGPKLLPDNTRRTDYPWEWETTNKGWDCPHHWRGKELCQGNHQEMPATTSPEPFREASGAQEGHRLSDISGKEEVPFGYEGWLTCSWEMKRQACTLPCPYTVVPFRRCTGSSQLRV